MKFIGTRRYSVWEEFIIEADTKKQAMDRLMSNFLLGKPTREIFSEGYSDYEIEEDNDE